MKRFVLALALSALGCGDGPTRAPPHVTSKAQAIRPTDPNSGLQFAYSPGEIVEAYDSVDGGFKVHFTRSGKDKVLPGDANDSGIPDFVEQVANVYDDVDHFYAAMGFRHPLSDQGQPDNGGDGRFDVYLIDFATSADGAFAPDACPGDGSTCYGYVSQENDFIGYPYPTPVIGTITLGSHEYFHAIQSAYDWRQGVVVQEGTAVLGEEEYDPALDDFEGFIGRAPAMLVSVALLAGFVLANGLRAIAWVSVLKDALMIVAALAVGIGIPYTFFGGIGPMFAALAHAKPAHLVMPGATANLGHSWFITTVILTSLGVCLWPHNFGAAYGAKSADTLRRNAMVMPIYSLSLALMIFVGFAAVLEMPGLRDGDLSLLAMVRKAFPPWFLGVIGGAGALTAMVPAAILTLSCATLFAKNIVRPIFAPGMNDHEVGRLARIMVVVVSSISLLLALRGSSTLVALLLLGYAGITQLFPGVVLGLFWERASAAGIFLGLGAGVALVAVLAATKHDPFFGMNAGFVGLCLNFAIAIGGSLLVRSQSPVDSVAA